MTEKEEVEVWRKWKMGNRQKIQNLQSAQGTGLYLFQTMRAVKNVDIPNKSLVEGYGKIFSWI